MKVEETYTIDVACVNCHRPIIIKFIKGEMIPRIIHLWGLKSYKDGDKTECDRCGCLSFEEIE